MKKNLFYFAVALVLIIAAVFIFRARSYPIASVNENFISAEYFQAAVSSGRSYFTKEQEIAENLSDPDFKTEFDTELRRATLEAIIQHEIIRQELIALLGQEETSRKVAEKVSEVEEERTETTSQAVEEIFGIDWPTYILIVVEPEAYKEVLEEEIRERNLDFQIWMEDKLEKAEVDILLTGFIWLGKSVELN